VEYFGLAFHRPKPRTRNCRASAAADAGSREPPTYWIWRLTQTPCKIRVNSWFNGGEGVHLMSCCTTAVKCVHTLPCLRLHLRLQLLLRQRRRQRLLPPLRQRLGLLLHQHQLRLHRRSSSTNRKFDKKTLQVTLQNNSGSNQLLTALAITWPQATNGNLNSIKLGGTVIYNTPTGGGSLSTKFAAPRRPSGRLARVQAEP